MRRYDNPLIAVAIGLAALAGFVDALGFLSLGGFFVSFMSGNSTRFGVAIASGSAEPMRIAGGLLLAFVIGAAGAALLGHRLPRWGRPAVMLVVTLLLTLAALVHGAIAGPAALMLIAAAMGAENGVFRRDGEVSIGLTYMTGTLVRFAQRAALALIGEDRWGWVPHLLLWSGFVVGVTLGASAYPAFGLGALWFAAGASALLTLILAGLVARS